VLLEFRRGLPGLCGGYPDVTNLAQAEFKKLECLLLGGPQCGVGGVEQVAKACGGLGGAVGMLYGVTQPSAYDSVGVRGTVCGRENGEQVDGLQPAIVPSVAVVGLLIGAVGPFRSACELL
jgi:hypothetical protein